MAYNIVITTTWWLSVGHVLNKWLFAISNTGHYTSYHRVMDASDYACNQRCVLLLYYSNNSVGLSILDIRLRSPLVWRFQTDVCISRRIKDAESVVHCSCRKIKHRILDISCRIYPNYWLRFSVLYDCYAIHSFTNVLPVLRIFSLFNIKFN